MSDVAVLHPDRIVYLQKVVDVLESPEPLTDSELLLENVFQEIGTCFMSALCTKDSSLLIEKLLNLADGSWSSRFTLDLVGNSWPELLQNPYASRVFDTAMKALTRSEIEPQRIVEFVSLFYRSAKILSAMIASQYASQSLKHLIVMLNSYPAIRKTKIHFRHVLIQHVNLVEVAMTTHGSSFLQFLLLDSYHFDEKNHEQTPPSNYDLDLWTITNSEEWDSNGGSTEYQLIHTALTVDDNKFGTLVRNQAASHLVEVMLKISPASSYALMLETLFKGKILNFVNHPVANFVIQKLIEYVRTEDQFKQIYEEIKHNIAEFFKGRSGVVVKLAHVALRHPAYQPLIINQLLEALSGSNSDSAKSSFCRTLLQIKNTPKHVFKKKNQKATDEKFSSIGCQLLTELFKFDPKHSSFIVDGFSSLDSEILMSLALDRVASRTFESFLQSRQIPSSKKQTFFDIITNGDLLQKLALDKSGSHVLDRIFESSDLNSKLVIADNLIKIYNQLVELPHGRYVVKNMKLTEYRQNKDEWKSSQASKVNALKAFEDILSFTPAQSSTSNEKSKKEKSKASTSSESEQSSKKDQSNQANSDEKKHRKEKSDESSSKKKHKDKSSKSMEVDKKEDDQVHKEKHKKSKKEKPVESVDTSESANPKKRKREASDELDAPSSKKAAKDLEDLDSIFAKAPETAGTSKKAEQKSHTTVLVEAVTNSDAAVNVTTTPDSSSNKPLSKLKQKKLAKELKKKSK